MDAPVRRRRTTDELSETEVASIRAMLVASFGTDPDEAFTDDDWAHALGGVHLTLDIEGVVVAHGSIVERWLDLGGRAVRTGYVEAVAVSPHRQGIGLGSTLMAAITTEIRERFDLGALGTGRHAFYARLGWMTWQGPAFVRAPDGRQRTPDDEGFIMVLPTPTSPPLDLTGPITCDWREGDVW